MKCFQIKTLDELKSYGSFDEVRQSIKSSFGSKVILKARSWAELLEAIKQIQILVGDKSIKASYENNLVIESDESSLYFKSEAARIIYSLIELDGESRLKELKITRSHYRDLEKAKKWRNKLAMIIHPDKCNHPNAALATNKLNEMFENMVSK